MSTYEQDRVQKILKDHAEADRLGQRLVFSSRDGTIRAVSRNDPDRSYLDVGPQQLGFSGVGKHHDHNSL